MSLPNKISITCSLNLDAMDDEELDALAAECRRHEDAMGHIFLICKDMRAARSCRKAGNIKEALKLEGFVEDHYKRLPEWARW